ncbi:hypothetical protein [Methylocapsa palsarum]|uniref:Uncharacterized protein n=1 Tax=Methylocapsa palsarum TaxID=1612308 RepID=A0A1I3VSS4_9HYPH|nr:hypothetical protein [Methylocapsa palsarum]SFJ97973.1 hypothetical protein SAMN05444581_10155 [Methylocapsa palsarum]
MQTKLLEIRDQSGRIPVLAMEIGPRTEAGAELLQRFGLAAERGVVVVNLKNQTALRDSFTWENNSAMQIAHAYIDGRFEQLTDGDVVDVEFILGETPKGGDPFKE